MRYKIKTGTIVAGGWSLCIIIGLSLIKVDSESNFLCWGPSDVQFAGFKVNTWMRWAIVMIYSILSQVSYSVISSTISPYISNVIRDHKTPIEEKGTLIQAQSIVFVYTLYSWLTSILDVFLWITLQVQYIIPALLTDLLLTIYFTNTYMKPLPVQLLE